MNKIIPEAVKQVYDGYPHDIHHKLLQIRQLIFEIAASNKAIGEIEETIKWGEPSYLTSNTKSGSTIRLGWKASSSQEYAIYFNCKTTLVSLFKDIFGDTFKYEGSRAIWFNLSDELPLKELSFCIEAALTYHLNKTGHRRL